MADEKKPEEKKVWTENTPDTTINRIRTKEMMLERELLAAKQEIELWKKQAEGAIQELMQRGSVRANFDPVYRVMRSWILNGGSPKKMTFDDLKEFVLHNLRFMSRAQRPYSHMAEIWAEFGFRISDEQAQALHRLDAESTTGIFQLAGGTSSEAAREEVLKKIDENLVETITSEEDKKFREAMEQAARDASKDDELKAEGMRLANRGATRVTKPPSKKEQREVGKIAKRLVKPLKKSRKTGFDKYVEKRSEDPAFKEDFNKELAAARNKKET